MKPYRMVRNVPVHLWSIDFWPRYEDNSTEEIRILTNGPGSWLSMWENSEPQSLHHIQILTWSGSKYIRTTTVKIPQKNRRKLRLELVSFTIHNEYESKLFTYSFYSTCEVMVALLRVSTNLSTHFKERYDFLFHICLPETN